MKRENVDRRRDARQQQRFFARENPRLIEDGVTECNQIAQEMKVSPATVSRFAKRAIDAGWLRNVKREYVLAEGEK